MAGKLRLASSGGDIKVWDMPELSMVKAFSPHSQPVGSLCWSPNNQCLASAANDKVVVTFAKEDVFNPTEITVEEGNTCVAFNSSSRYLLIGGKSKTLSIWDMKTKSIKKTYKDHKDVVSCLVFNWNDTAIASGSVDGDILLHNVITGQASDPFRLPKTQAVRDIQFSYFKKSLLGAVSDDGALNLWDSNTRKLLTSFAADHKAPATGLSFSPMNDMLLCSVGLDKRIVFYDVQGKKSVKVMTAESPLTAVDFMADGATLAVGSTRGKIFLYDLRSGSTPVGMTAAHKTSVQSLAFQSSVKVSSAGNNRSLKPAASNLKPPSRQAPEPPKATTDPSPPSTPLGKQPESAAAQYSNIKQNGVKEDEEDIFSPLREVKTAAVNSSAVSLAGSQQDSSTNYKENNPPDISGIFSPLGSNPSVSAQPHPSVGPAAAQLNNDQQRGISPKTVGETTANAPTTSQNTRSVSNVGSSGTRSLSDLRPAQGLGPGNNFKSYSDSHLITGQGQVNTRPFSDSSLGGSLVPSSARPHSGSALDTRPPLDGGTGKRSEGDFSPENSQGFRNGLNTEVYDSSKQPFIRTPPGSNRKGSRDGTEKVPLPSSPSRVRRPADGAGTVNQGLGLHGAVSTTGGSSQVSSERHMLDEAKLSPEPLFSGAVTMVAPDVTGASVGNAGLLPFQVQFIKNLIDESLDEFRVALHKDIVNVQVEMLRQFQIQQNELKAMLQKYSVNEALVTEIERLKEENNRLKTKY